MRRLAERITQNSAKLAVFNAVRQLGRTTVSAIKSRVKLSKPTVLKYLCELTLEGLVSEGGQAESSTGRPPKLFSVNASAAFTVGVDFGAPDLTIALIDLGRNVVDRRKLSTQLDESPSRTAKRIILGIREIASANSISLADQLLGAAVGVPCCIDREAELVLPIARLPHWENVPLKAIIERDIGFSVSVEMGTHFMVLGERAFCGEEDIENMLYIHLREGIGMGAFVDGRLLRGSRESACEIGHMMISPEGPECGCGRRGCLEVFASEPAMLKNARSLMNREMTAEGLFTAVREGDVTAQRVVGEALDYLAIAIANTVDLFDPELIVLGGNIVNAGDFVIRHLNDSLTGLGLDCQGSGISLQFSMLGIYAGALGAANFALERAFKSLSIKG